MKITTVRGAKKRNKSNKRTVSMRYFHGMQKKLKEDYDVDVFKEVILASPNQIILVAELTNPEAIHLYVIAGSLDIIGFNDEPSIALSTFFDHFDFDNGYAKVAGEKQYFEEIRAHLTDFSQQPNVTLPLVNNDEKYWIRFHAILLESNKNLAAVFITNVTDFLAEEEALFTKTHHDPLTGVFNNYTLDYHYGARYQLPDFHVFFLDLDDFKILNDKHGHKTGNAFLCAFTAILKTYESGFNRFYRIGGDEFVGLFFEKEANIRAMAEDIINKTIQLSKETYDVKTSVSIGIVQATVREDVIAKADKVLYKAKKRGKNQYIYEIETP